VDNLELRSATHLECRGISQFTIADCLFGVRAHTKAQDNRKKSEDMFNAWKSGNAVLGKGWAHLIEHITDVLRGSQIGPPRFSAYDLERLKRTRAHYY
jgi:hypothetical protein